ncbi:cation transporter [Prolixibacteraceae bacterium JC049]|nr:cation transporter [Prolixibacteraceae bacterium JC049]
MPGKHHKQEAKTLWVVLLTAITMVVEIIFGLTTKSMALLADGIHMGSHVLAIGLSWLAYVIVRKVSKSDKFNGNSDKILSLSGYSSGLMLLIFAIVIMVEALERFVNPVEIEYKEAIMVASIGLVVNIASAFLLHHNSEDSDHNIRAAYLHVIADALTSLSAILGLIAAMIWDIPFVDTIAAVVSSLVIIKWSVGLLKDSGSVLLDIETGHKGHNHDHGHEYHHH